MSIFTTTTLICLQDEVKGTGARTRTMPEYGRKNKTVLWPPDHYGPISDFDDCRLNHQRLDQC